MPLRACAHTPDILQHPLRHSTRCRPLIFLRNKLSGFLRIAQESAFCDHHRHLRLFQQIVCIIRLYLFRIIRIKLCQRFLQAFRRCLPLLGIRIIEYLSATHRLFMITVLMDAHRKDRIL